MVVDSIELSFKIIIKEKMGENTLDSVMKYKMYLNFKCIKKGDWNLKGKININYGNVQFY